MNRPELKSLYKILHTTCHIKWESHGDRIFNESVWMEKNGHTIIIAAPVDSLLFLRAKEHGFKVYGVDFKFFSKIKDYTLLKNIFYNEKPDVINTHGNRDAMLALFTAKKACVPCRILSRHVTDHIRNSWYNRIVYKRLCQYIFTTSDHTKRYLQKVFKLKDLQIFSIPDGIVRPDTLLEKARAREALAKELCLDPGTKFIGFAGRVARGRGISLLLKAFKKAQPKLPGYHVAIVGKGTQEYLNSLQRLAQTLQIDSQVHFTGLKEEPWPWYRALDCAVLTPTRDINGVQKIPRELLEAMIYECPVIGYRHDGNSIDILDHRKTGLLCETPEPSEIADKILETLQDEDATRNRVHAARNLVEKKHTIDTMGRDIIRIYRLHQVKMDRRLF